MIFNTEYLSGSADFNEFVLILQDFEWPFRWNQLVLVLQFSFKLVHDKWLESEQYLALLKNTNTVPALWPLSHDKVLVRSTTLKVLGSLLEGLYNIRAVASGRQGGNCNPPPKPANNFLKRPNLRARLPADSFLSSFSKLKSQEIHF